MGLSFHDREERLSRFEEDYHVAWMASDRPDQLDSLETLLAALGDEQPKPELHALWVFFRCCLQENVPLNWVHQYHPESVAAIKRAIEFSRGQFSSIVLGESHE